MPTMKTVAINERVELDLSLTLSVDCKDGHELVTESIWIPSDQRDLPGLIDHVREHLRNVYLAHRGQMH